jgi:hypothetical protein
LSQRKSNFSLSRSLFFAILLIALLCRERKKEEEEEEEEQEKGEDCIVNTSFRLCRVVQQ